MNVSGLSADPEFQAMPFQQINVYKVVAGALSLVGSVTAASVTDNTTTGSRVYTYVASGIQLTPVALNTFYAVGRDASGNAVISQAVTVVNP